MSISENLMDIEERIQKACDRAGRKREEVTLICVSKTKPVSAVEEAYSAGQRNFGENKVQEILDKAPALPEDIKWHMIGHLQRNKVKQVIERAALIHSVDSFRLAEEINIQALKRGITVPILMEVNAAGEESKFGVSVEDAFPLAEQISELTAKLKEIEELLQNRCREIPHAENLLEIQGVGEKELSGILAEMGDITRFDSAKEIQKLSGLSLVACSSGKHKGQTKISHRGRKRLRYWLFLAARSAATYSEEFKALHVYYTTRPDNPLKKMQSLIVIACKLLRVIFTMLRTGQKYDPEKLMRDIRYPARSAEQAA